MRFVILVLSPPYGHQGPDSAYHFARAALEQGHELLQVFFHQDGVWNASAHTAPPGDDRDVAGRWFELSRRGVDLVLCVTAGARRGVVPPHLAPGFRAAGLGQLAAALGAADRVVVFGD